MSKKDIIAFPSKITEEDGKLRELCSLTESEQAKIIGNANSAMSEYYTLHIDEWEKLVAKLSGNEK